MIDAIGIKRAIIICVLIFLNAILGLVTYLYLIPENEASAKRLKSLKSEVSSVQTDINNMQIEFEKLGLQQNDFEELRATGFFKLQTRNEAKDLFKLIQEQSGVISAVVSVKAGAIEDNIEAQKAKHKILASTIEIDIKAYDDTQIYKYIALAQKNFIGNLSMDSLMLRRIGDVTPQVLRAIASGSNPELVTAKLKMIWRTMIPEDQVISKDSLD